MLNIGIRAHDLGKSSAKELVNKVRLLGFDGVQLVLKKALLSEVTIENILELKKDFKKTSIFMLGAYFNMIHPDIKVCLEGSNYFKKMIDYASFLNVGYVASETGSLSVVGQSYHIDNSKEIYLNQVIEITKELVEYAKAKNVTVLLEGAYAHVARFPSTLKYIIDEVNSSNLDVVVDIYNYLNLDNYNNYLCVFIECLDLFMDRIKILHLKNFVLEDNKLVQVGLDKGIIDYNLLLKEVLKRDLHPILIFEGVVGDDIKSSLKYIKKILEGLK
ncbi:MAG: sugar phosphate isomerase/epimerase [Acholeplasmatales bacterium]|nr:sugar phosphate isomerase/epimerase [Acholeplasmatales bacterium]